LLLQPIIERFCLEEKLIIFWSVFEVHFCCCCWCQIWSKMKWMYKYGICRKQVKRINKNQYFNEYFGLSGVNFINILREHFSFEMSFRQLFSSNMYVKKWRSYEKFVRLTLMKLTTGLTLQNDILKNVIYLKSLVVATLNVFFCKVHKYFVNKNLFFFLLKVINRSSMKWWECTY